MCASDIYGFRDSTSDLSRGASETKILTQFYLEDLHYSDVLR
jgi:hypothetical protein